MTKSIGIDLGTTNSAAAVKKLHVDILNNSEGDAITPSCVCVKNKKILGMVSRSEFIVGKHALEWIKQDPKNTVTAIKRLMGRSITNPEVKKIIEDPRHFNIITSQERGTANSLVIRLNNKEYTPEEISSKILAKIQKDAQARLNDEVAYAVITVPAYFNDKQKHATRAAAALAGIKVQRLLPEPTAAAISFGVDEIGQDDARTILVFDFGGGTFDLSVLTISGGQFIEQGKGGNMWLGGEDIDREIEKYVLSETAREYEIDDFQGMLDEMDAGIRTRFWGELKMAVEKAKISLSEDREAYIEVLGLLKDADGDLLDVDVTLTRDRFETLMQPMLDNALTLTRNLLADIYFTPDMIDNVLMVGGSSQIPCIIEAVKKEFGSSKILVHDRPMLAIAEGAAILSHRLSDTYECLNCGKIVGQSDTRCRHCDFDLEAYTVEHGVFDIVHAAAHDYYVVLENGDKYLFAEKHTPLPFEQTQVFKLVDKNQRLVHMKFLNIVNNEDESIGDFWLGIDNNALMDYRKNQTEEDAETPLSIAVTLSIDENNLVEVTAVLSELPKVELSKTLSRGKADEKLFMDLEAMIDDANEAGYDTYMIDEITTRSTDIIADIHKVIDKNTGNVIEPVYNLAKMKIEKARRMAEEDNCGYPLIFYAEDIMFQFSDIMTAGERGRLQKKIDHLKDMNQHGTYEENIEAIRDMEKALDEFPVLNVLMNIVKAAELCEEHDPGRAPQFSNAMGTIVEAMGRKNHELVNKTLESIMPRVREVLSQYDSRAGSIQKGITR